MPADDIDKTFVAAKGSLRGDRPENQDRCLFLSSAETTLLCLADGLGGHPRGEVAAQLLMDVTETFFRQADKPLADPENFMLQCVGKAHQSILRFGRRQAPPIAPRTTAVLAVVQDGVAYWAHVGDSRLYLIRNGLVTSQTRDHAQVCYVRHSGGAASRPRASLTRCLGGQPQPPTTTCSIPTRLQHGDVLLLCSDGLWGQVSQQALVNAFDVSTNDIDQRLRTLLDLAAAAPNSDNVSAVVLRWLGQDTAGAPGATPSGADDSDLDQAIEQLESMLEQAGNDQSN